MSDLTEAETEMLSEAYETHIDGFYAVYAAVERILADRLRAAEAERDRALRIGAAYRSAAADYRDVEDRAEQAEADLATERAAHEALRAKVAALADGLREQFAANDYTELVALGDVANWLDALLDADTAGGA